MCGCAVELNMNSFIRAEQKDAPNTNEAQASVCAHTQTHTHLGFCFKFLCLLLVNDTLKDFSERYFFIPREMCVHCLLFFVFLSGSYRESKPNKTYP